MVHISHKEVMHIAHISTIALCESEVSGIIIKLQSVLSYAQRVAELAKADGITDEMVNLHNIFRQDVSSSADSQQLFDRAPHVEGEFFVVPLILDSAE